MRRSWVCIGILGSLAFLWADPEDPASRRWREDQTEKALKGNVSSMLALGDRYLVEGEKDLARKWFRDAADLNATEGVWKLIGIEERRPLKERAQIVEKLYRELIAHQEPRGYFRLGRLYSWPKSPLRDLKRGRLYLEDAAERGVLDAKLLLGKLYLGNWEHSQNFFVAIEWLSKAAREKSPEAHRHLGMVYRYGMGTSQNLEKAWEHYSEAAKLKDAESMFIIAEALYEGKDISQDLPRAHRYYTDAAENGYSRANDRLKERKFNP